MFKLEDLIGHNQIKQTLKNSIQRDRVAHAYLFMGPPGVGKKTAAQAFARVLLCEEPQNGDVCGLCRSCGQLAGENHPDLHLLQPAGASLKIEQIRELQKQVQYKPYQAKRQVFIIEQVEAMTQEAANCFLKTLEEPSGQTTFILLSDQPYALLPTILSRCQQFQFRPLANQEIAMGLVRLCGVEETRARELAPLAGGSLGRALRLASGDEQWPLRAKFLELVKRLPRINRVQALATAEEFASERNEAVEILELLLLWFRDLLVYHYTQNKGLLINRDQLSQILEQINLYDPLQLTAILEEIKAAKERIVANANTRMTLEVLMLKIQSFGGNNHGS